MATNEESSSIPSERYYRDRHCAYKKLLADLAQHLGPENVKVIAFNCSLSESLKQSSALDVLDYLDKHAKFSPTNIQPLAELLTDAYRNDLVNDYVDRYRLKFGTAKYVGPYANTKVDGSYSDGLRAYLADCKCTVFNFRTVHV